MKNFSIEELYKEVDIVTPDEKNKVEENRHVEDRQQEIPYVFVYSTTHGRYLL